MNNFDSNSYYGFEEILEDFNSENDIEDINNNYKENINNECTKQNYNPNIEQLSNLLDKIETENNISKSDSVNNDGKDIKNNNKKKEQVFYLGHRQRARERFLALQGEISDYDLLELILFLIIPRTDVKPIARILLDKYNTYEKIFNAPDDELIKCGVNGKSLKYLLMLFKEFNKRYCKQILANNELCIQDFQQLVNYCHNIFFGLQEEEFHILFFNNQLKLIEDKNFGLSQVSNVSLDIRSIVKKALDLHTKSVVLCHNHPSGNNLPSQDDIRTTDEIAKMLFNLDIDVLDHIIITDNSYYSFRENNLLLNKF